MKAEPAADTLRPRTRRILEALRPGTSRARRPSPRSARIVTFAAVTVGVVALVLLADRLPQNPRYHLFADRRAFLGIPNAANVLSNVGFVAVGVWGLLAVFRLAAFDHARERWPWIATFAGIALTAVGSAWYHLAPTNASLVWDRLPMTLAFMGLFSALIAERVSIKAGVALLGPLLLLGLGSVAYWAATEARGAGDLRPYVLVQLYPLLAIPLLLALFPARYARSFDLLIALAWYMAAKIAEAHDARIFGLLGIVSGHTVKHVLAAVGAGWLVRMLILRQPLLGRRHPG